MAFCPVPRNPKRTAMDVPLLLLLLATTTACHQHFQPDNADDLRDVRFTRDMQHIREDLETYFNTSSKDISKISGQELEFYYFELHDFDENGKLDGLELLRAIQHVIEHHQQSAHIDFAAHVDKYAAAVDQVFQTDDLDRDGFLSYQEFVYAQQRHQS